MGDFTSLLMRFLDIGADLISKFLSVAQNTIIIGILSFFTWKYGLSHFNKAVLFAVYAYLIFQILRALFDLVGQALLDKFEARILHEDPLLRRISERVLFPPFSRHTFNTYADARIQAIFICREPIQSYIRYLMAGTNAIFGQTFGNIIGATYEPIYHVSLLIVVKKAGKVHFLKLQRTEVVELLQNFEIRGTVEMISLNVPQKLSIRRMIEKMRGKVPFDNFVNYSLYQNNCQTFACDLLQANGLLDDDVKVFIKQDIKKFFSDLVPITIPFSEMVVKLTRVFDYIFRIK